ncbi:MAG TPA: hypothetical protein DFK12_14150 [Gallionellaceae bacterium]|jgi:2-polyprenyl-3-methyl-5-hydroxy-6-metoxy-1,4-benzoquinol methylase|nr:hypothetical protein [Gallionellaceae bacterium]
MVQKNMSHQGAITELGKLDAALRHAAEARKISETKFLEALSTFWLDMPPTVSDPWSDEYRQHWWDVYKHLAGRDYHVQNEQFEFEIDSHVLSPYPYCTRDYNIVSRQLMGMGAIIRALALPPGAAVLEMGAGWGNLSLFLAQMGYKVTVLDINSRYGELIQQRAAALGVEIEFICGEFDDAPKWGRRFDCVLFFESFHHSYDHLSLLDSLPALLTEGGLLALTGEPINENLSYDWGINPAGEALWQIRTHGWFELVFKESYLIKTLEHKGYSVSKIECADNPVGTSLLCRRS